MNSVKPQSAAHKANSKLLLIVAAVGGIVAIAVNQGPPAPATPAAPAPSAAPRATFLDRPYVSPYLLKSLAADLREPESAIFSDTHFIKVEGQVALCGRVNARNGFGGMTGPRAFIAAVTEQQTGKMAIFAAPQCGYSG